MGTFASNRPPAYGIRKRRGPVGAMTPGMIRNALASLYLARAILVNAEAFHAAERVRAAIKSTEGAYNHARSMLARQERAK